MTKEKKMTSDSDLAINLGNVIRAYCTLKGVSLHISNTQTLAKIELDNIRVFYTGDYFLVTLENGEEIHHKITRYLYKKKLIHKARGRRRHHAYSIKNDYKSLQVFQNEKCPKDLFHPIKIGINKAFFDDDYFISDFSVIDTGNKLIHKLN